MRGQGGGGGGAGGGGGGDTPVETLAPLQWHGSERQGPEKEEARG